ncbi:hypothetical protein HD806DRAFT_337793 [Xylariaceae sp. AK1471]|nr:hypothetical protein HD806DRAFT_337793 [Xylariaceae sp. AK1471]
MRLLSLLPVCLVASFALGDTPIPPPGQPALEYTDGIFSEPDGAPFNYRPGSKMNVSWDTTYETSNLYLIVGYDFAAPIQIITNTAQNWFQWDVTTDSTNSSEIYVFRVVNGSGTANEQAVGGFLSASFYIPLIKTETTSTSTTISSTTSTTSTSTTSTTALAKAPTAPAPDATQSMDSVAKAAISEGSRIGIGVGVGVGVLGVGALLAAFLFWRRSKKRQQPPAPGSYELPHNGSASPNPQNAQPYTEERQALAAGYGTSPHAQTAQPYSDQQQALAGYYKPPETGEVRGAELDAGQGYNFVPEAYTNNKTTRAELQ